MAPTNPKVDAARKKALAALIQADKESDKAAAALAQVDAVMVAAKKTGK